MRIPPVQADFFQLKGGLNLVSPPLAIPDGMCRDALNWEVSSDGGYSRIAGYERYDGRTAPSSATYSTIPLSSLTGTVVVGDTVNGATSGATARVLAVSASALLVTKVTGAFVAETIRVGATPVATSSGGNFVGGATSALLDATYTSAAANVYRADIQAVPGSGPVRGVWMFNGQVYAFRDNAGGTACVMHKASASGWTSVALNHEVAFSNANTSVNEGETLTQGAVTATILRVVVRTGTLLSGTNTGTLILSTPSGGTFAAGAATSTGGGSLTLSGASAAITLAPGGRYEFSNYNFGGASGTRRMYGVSGVGPAFEFDGTVYVPIRTGMATDAPSHLAIHQNYLFLSYGASVQRSGIGTPYAWTIITGAAEIAVGDAVTNLIPTVGSTGAAALAIFTVNKTMVLYGSTEADFQLVTFNNEAGGYAYSAQSVSDIFVLDQLGIRQLSASQNYGNFDDAQVSRLVRPWLAQRLGSVKASCVVRNKNQYRLFFSDKSALYLTFNNGKLVGIMPCTLEHEFHTVISEEASTGAEALFAAGTDGFVYSLDNGTSFDGAEIVSYMMLAFSYMRGPRTRKNFKKAVYEMSGAGYAEFDMAYELSYASPQVNQGVTVQGASPLGAVNWDAFTWDSFYWDGKTLLPIEQKLFGTGENLSLIIRSTSALFRQFTLNSAIIHYLPRRQAR